MKQKTALKSKVLTTMRQHKRVFFIAQLHSIQSAAMLPVKFKYFTVRFVVKFYFVLFLANPRPGYLHSL